MEKIKSVVRDVLFVSKITGTKNKKILVFISVLLSQFSALTDVFLIAVFSALIVGQYTNIDFLNLIIEFFVEQGYLIILIILFRYLFLYIQNMILKRMELDVNRNLRSYLLGEVFDKRNYSISDSFFFINTLSGHISFFYGNFAGFLNGLFQMIVFTSYLVISDARSVSIFAIGIIVLAYPTKKLLLITRDYMHQAYEKTREANSEIQRVVENMFLVKILKTEDYEINRYKKTMEIQTENLLQNHKFGIINGYLPTFFTFLTLSFFLSFSTFATVITLDFIGVTLKLFQSLGFLTNCLNQIVNSHVHIAKFYQLEKNKIISRKENFVVSNSSSIKFENVDFKYFNSESNIFENLNFELKEKSHTVITGSNGSGKSTLLGLLSGVFYPDRGKIYTFSDKFAYIGAVPLIFYDTLKNNLVYGNNSEVEEKELINLLKHLNTFKEEEGYNLNREVSNKNLSSGQMQKIAFIRALISDPEILVLDEATANLDEESKIKIFDILSERKITIVNSTHDPTSFKNVDTNLKIEVSDKSRKVLLV